MPYHQTRSKSVGNIEQFSATANALENFYFLYCKKLVQTTWRHSFHSIESEKKKNEKIKIKSNYCFYETRKFCYAIHNTAQEMNFPLRISSENVTKSAVSCGFGHIY